MKQYRLSATRKYYEFTLKTHGYNPLQIGTTLSPYLLQAMIGPTDLLVTERSERSELKHFKLFELTQKKYFLIGRHDSIQDDIHSLFQLFGLKRVSQVNSLADEDLIFMGTLNDTQQLDDEALYLKLWMINRDETSNFLSHLKHLNESIKQDLHTHFKWLLGEYENYPYFTTSLKECSTMDSSTTHTELVDKDLIPRLRVTVVNSRLQKPRPSRDFNDQDLSFSFELRWSFVHFSWANIIIILWRGRKAQEPSPFGLDHLKLLPLFCYRQTQGTFQNCILISPQGKLSAKKGKRFHEHQEEWMRWQGHPLDLIEVSTEDFDALEHGHTPSNDTLLHLWHCIGLRDDNHPISSKISHFLPLRVVPAHRFSLSQCPISSDLLPSLGLIEQREVDHYRVKVDRLWWFARPISLQTLYDTFGSLSTHLIKIIGKYGDIEDRVPPSLPLFLNTTQALLLCDLVNLLIGLETTYFSKKTLRKLSSTSSRPPLQLKAMSAQSPSFRLPSLLERERLSLLPHNQASLSSQRGRSSQVWREINWGLEAWGTDHEWSHDDYYHWNLRLDHDQISDPFGSSVLIDSHMKELSSIKMNSWYPRFNDHRRIKQKKRQNRALLRLVYHQPYV
jgi:hypothetical protein